MMLFLIGLAETARQFFFRWLGKQTLRDLQNSKLSGMKQSNQIKPDQIRSGSDQVTL